jgi:hypothetical protein
MADIIKKQTANWIIKDSQGWVKDPEAKLCLLASSRMNFEVRNASFVSLDYRFFGHNKRLPSIGRK